MTGEDPSERIGALVVVDMPAQEGERLSPAREAVGVADIATPGLNGLAGDIKSLVKSQPAAALGAAVLCGFILGRLLAGES